MQTHNVKPVTCLMIFPLSDMSDVSDFIHVRPLVEMGKNCIRCLGTLDYFP